MTQDNRPLRGASAIGSTFRAIVVAVCLLASPPLAARVEDFTLLDQRGKAHQLYYYRDAPAIVLMIQGNGCPIVRGALHAFGALRDRYARRGVQFFMLNPNLQDDRTSIRREAETYGIDVPILDDDTQLIGESLGLTRTAEILVIDPSDWSVAYRGPVDDRQSYGREKAKAEQHYVADALDALLAGNEVEVGEHEAMGCLINFPEQSTDHTQISYSETIAPLLIENCAECHRPGGIGPWAMTEYKMIQGFAPMIREVIRTRRMPPWQADPEVGRWKRDRSLSIEEKQTLVHWIEAGAPRGEGPDPLPQAVTPKTRDWNLGEPDFVIEVPAFDVPATGSVDYQFPVVANPIGRDVWVRAAELMPGDASVVHHVLAGSGTIEADMHIDSVFDNYLLGYAAGAEYQKMPEGTGVFVSKDDAFLFQVHYAPMGRAVTDRSRLALYFHEAPPRTFLRHNVILNPALRIPANSRAHEEAAYFAFHRDAVLYQVLPHSHYRGRHSTFSLVHPDGREELLLSVPSYDFNWQRGYEFVEPVRVPAGSRLMHRTVYDNSAQNLGNPDPDREVPWGLQSDDEMLYGDFIFSWVDESSKQPIEDRGRMRVVQMFGWMDRDMNGRLELEEMPVAWTRRWGTEMRAAEKDGESGLSVEEYLALQREIRRTSGAVH